MAAHSIVFSIVDHAGEPFASRVYTVDADTADLALDAAWSQAEDDHAGFVVAGPSRIDGNSCDPEVDWLRRRFDA